MRGLPFPAEALFNREQSHDFGSPGPGATVPNGVPTLSDVVPLDPALSGPSSALAYFPQVNGVNGINGHAIEQGDPVPSPYSALSPTYLFEQYPQGPEGDPFAPPPHLIPGPALGGAPNSRQGMQQKHVKRSKRKPRREEECGFCSGDDNRNKTGEPERMVTCTDCGRSGHPSCMDLGSLGSALYNYAWKCIECKTCEICIEKGDDERILFCDNCDRGWHTYCLNPPLQENPEGSWYCPQCAPPPGSAPPPVAPELQHGSELQIDPALQTEEDSPMEIDPALRGDSVVSTVPSEPHPRNRCKASPRKSSRVVDRKGKGRTLILTDEEEEVVVEVEVGALDEEEEMDPFSSNPRGRPPSNRRKSNARARRRTESVPDDVEGPPPLLRQQKRMKMTIQSPSPPRQSGPGRPPPKIKLRLNVKGKGREDEEDDEPRKCIFEDVLSEPQRDTSKTNILNSDRDRFEKARSLAESKLILPPQKETIDLSSIPGPSNGRFPLRSAIHQLQQQQTQALLSTAASSVSPSPSTPGPSVAAKYDPSVLRIRTIRFGPYDIQTWYDAPFPEEFSDIPEGRLWICEFCLKYMKSRFGAQRHRLKCKCRHPPGDEIYRDGKISIFEVDGRKNKIYCQHLCLLSKMFLDHKSLFYDVEPFLFYVMTQVDEVGARFVGYFSKEKRSSKDLNLSCIMTLPVRQRQGWGNLLIDFSYLLSRKERKCGTPERPLSALGAIGYRKYWTLAIMRYLRNAPISPRLEDICSATGMTIEDIYNTLMHLNMIAVYDSSSPSRPSPGRSVKINRNRRNGVARRNLQKAQPTDDDKSKPFVPPTNYGIHWDPEDIRRFMDDWNAKGYLTLKPEKLTWTPFLLSRADKLATPLEDVLTTTPVDIENTAVTPATEQADTQERAEDVFGPVLASTASIDVDVPTPTPLVSIASVSESVRADSNARTTLVDNQTPISEAEQRASEAEDSPTPSPSPTPIYSIPRSTSSLEALAAVAFVVAKANPVDLSRKPSTNGAGTNDSAFSNYAPNGSIPNVHIHLPSQSPQPPVKAPVSFTESRSRKPSAKTEDYGTSLHEPTSRPCKDVQSQSDSLPPTPSKPHKEDDSIPPSPTTQRTTEEQDAEFAARLAREESAQRRSLRSSSHSASTVPTLASRDARPKETSRKRQKAPSTVELSPPPTPVSPDRPTTRRQAQAIAIETAKANAGRMTRRQSSRLAVSGGDNGLVSISGSPLKRSARANGASRHAAPEPSAKSVHNQGSKKMKSQKGRATRSQRTRNTSERSSLSGCAGDEGKDIEADAELELDAEGNGDDHSSSANVSVDEQDSIIVSNDVKRTVNESSGDALGKLDSDDEVMMLTGPDRGHDMEKDISRPLSVHDELHTKGRLEAETNVDIVVEGEDIDAEGEPDDEDADGEPDPDAFS